MFTSFWNVCDLLSFAPPLMEALLRATGSYGIGFLVVGVPSLVVGVNLLRHKEA